MSIGEIEYDGPCDSCAHSALTCPRCGGKQGYPPPPAVPTIGPCRRCYVSIGDEPATTTTVDVEADTEILVIEPGAFSPTLTSGTQIESWRGLASDLIPMLGRVAVEHGTERANQVALILHKQLRDEMNR